jgi:hypothetical protein
MSTSHAALIEALRQALHTATGASKGVDFALYVNEYEALRETAVRLVCQIEEATTNRYVREDATAARKAAGVADDGTSYLINEGPALEPEAAEASGRLVEVDSHGADCADGSCDGCGEAWDAGWRVVRVGGRFAVLSPSGDVSSYRWDSAAAAGDTMRARARVEF